jgi:ATP-binding cassette subfamily C protein LapB
MNSEMKSKNLAWVLGRVAQLQGSLLDSLQLQSAVPQESSSSTLLLDLYSTCEKLNLPIPETLEGVDQAQLPLVTYQESEGWGVIVDRAASGSWVVEFQQQTTEVSEQKIEYAFVLKVQCDLKKDHDSDVGKTFKQHLKKSLKNYHSVVFEAAIATLFIGLLALATSLFSMQVYDRVIPGRSVDTLTVLAAGVMISIVIELAMKFARSAIMDEVVIGLDGRLSREIFEKLLSIRLDQLPPSVGTLASQIRGYEQVRSFYTATTLFALVDAPLGLIFIFVMAKIGDSSIAAVVIVAVVVSLSLGFLARSKINRFAREGAQFANMKTGLLVEAVEGAETIKSGGGNWKFLSRWIDVNARSIENDAKTRSVSEHLNYGSAALQQISYAALVVAGSWIVMKGEMTMGALIACSILSGRVLTPVMALPGMIVQYAHVKAAMDGLEKLFALKADNDGLEKPLLPQTISGEYVMQNVVYSYPGGNPAIECKKLRIRAGERIAILGPIGSGKSTLLRLMAGLYAPTSGQILLNGLDINHISRPVLTKSIGYLQQDHRLFQGTLRENLLIGLPDPGDERIFEVMQRTGMTRIVAAHSKGLDRPIMEGGKGLSGGQRQLLAFTRLILCQPKVLLLDEPTASMDDEQERQCLHVLAEAASQGSTLLVVTHKPNILQIVDRVIVIVGNQIVMDGPKNAVLATFEKNRPQVTGQVAHA